MNVVSSRRALPALLLWLMLDAVHAPAAHANPDSGDAPAAHAEPDSADSPAPPVLQFRPFVGVGATQRSFTRPVGTGLQTLTSAFVPAALGGIAVELWPRSDFSLTVDLIYQSSLWLTVTENPPFALPNDVHVQSRRLALSVTPSWRIGASSSVGIGLGATLRTFWPDVHALQTPSYGLVGPHLRAELALTLVGPLRVRITPELQWFALLDKSEQGPQVTGTARQGAAIGGELSLELKLRASTLLALTYRESHALAARFEDIERYLTIRIEEAFE